MAESLDTSSSAGKMLINVMASFAQFERERIGERIADVMAHRRRNLKVTGHVAFGYRREGVSLKPIQAEQSAIARMREMRARGSTLQTICGWLTENGIRPRGQHWYPRTISAILASKTAQTSVSLPRVLV